MELRGQKKDLQSDKRGSMTMAVESSGTSGKRVVEAKHVTKRFGERVMLEDFSTRILRGDRVAIVGPNGAGKTTLVKMLLGEIPIDAGDGQAGHQSRDLLCRPEPHGAVGEDDAVGP
jgi:ATP-binding cassette subfamily F protein uup